MSAPIWTEATFEEHRPRLRAVAYRMLGSFSDADDAVQETWLRVQRAGTDEVENPAAWLTTITSRVCLNMLRSRSHRREELDGPHLPDPIVWADETGGPEAEALLADSVAVAMLIVLETLTPAERLAFVLHDLFAVPFDEIATVVDRSPDAARQLASRARRRVQGAAATPDVDMEHQREVVDAFFAAARGGDLGHLISVLDPDVVLRSDGGAKRSASVVLHGAEEVASQAMRFANPAAALHPVVIGGVAGVLVTLRGRPFSLMAFTVRGGRIVAIDALADPRRIGVLAPDLGEGPSAN
jgi:RNA polymerase sigma-70 factor (ECF subfamily)